MHELLAVAGCRSSLPEPHSTCCRPKRARRCGFRASPCACGAAACCAAPLLRRLSLIAAFCHLTSRVSGSRLVRTRRPEELRQRLVSRRGRPLDADGKAG